MSKAKSTIHTSATEQVYDEAHLKILVEYLTKSVEMLEAARIKRHATIKSLQD